MRPQGIENVVRIQHDRGTIRSAVEHCRRRENKGRGRGFESRLSRQSFKNKYAMSKASAFLVFHKMADDDLKVGICPTFVSGQKTKSGCHITMGAPEDVLLKIMSGEFAVGLLVYDKKQFHETEDALNAGL